MPRCSDSVRNSRCLTFFPSLTSRYPLLTSPDDAKGHRQEIYNGTPHEAKWTHEALAGGAAFEAMHLWEKRQRAEGKTVNHGFAKEALVAVAAAEVDKLFETKGLDWLDKEKAKHHAKKQAEHLYDQHYGNYNHYDP